MTKAISQIFRTHITINQAAIVAIGTPGLGLLGHGMPMPMPFLLSFFMATGYAGDGVFFRMAIMNVSFALPFGMLYWYAIPRLTASFDTLPGKVALATVAFIAASYVLAYLWCVPFLYLLRQSSSHI